MKTLYVANDGTVFDTESDCRRYDELMAEIYGSSDDEDDSREYREWYYGF